MRNKIILPLALAAAALLLLVIAGVSAQGTLLPTARGGSLASHQDGRGASVARRDDRDYREYLSEEQRRQRGGIAGLPKEELGKQLFFDTNLSVSNSLSGGDWELDEVPAVRDPTHVAQIGRGHRVSTDNGQGCVALQ